MSATSPDYSREAKETIEFAELTIFRVLMTVLALAILAAVAAHGSFALAHMLPWAIALSLGLAAMLAGGVIGLLFAVPRRGAEVASQASGYVSNDNLVKVSDWLTGALTGVALATGKDIAHALWRFSGKVMPEQPGFLLACLVVGFAAGFLLSYLRLRANLEFIFAVGSRRANDASERIKDAVLASVAAEKIAQNNSSMREVISAVAKSAGLATPDRVRAIRSQFQASWNSEPHLGKFGGAASSRGYELVVASSKVGSHAQLIVDLEVRGTNSAAKLVLAEFHLHPSLPQPKISMPADQDGRVLLTIEMYETFVVGAVVKPGDVRLELDLSQMKEIPAEYRDAVG